MSMRKRVKTGMTFEDAWQLTTVQLVSAAEVLTEKTILNPSTTILISKVYINKGKN